MTLSQLIRPAVSLAIASCLAAGSAGAALADAGEGDHGGGVRTVSFLATGVGPGHETSLSAPGCQFGHQCTVESTGTAAVHAGAYAFLATYDSVLTIDYSKVSKPTPTTFCAPAAGTELLTSLLDSRDTIHKSLMGTLCGGDAAGAPHVFMGTYTITGGTGRFAGATGSGTLTATDDGFGTITSSTETGTITYRGAHEKGGDDGGEADRDHGHEGGDGGDGS